MNGINEVLLLGTVGADPETKILNENARVSTFSLATNETYTDKSGVKKELTEWHNIEAWNYLSDTVSNYVRKGTHIIVRGKIKTESYDDREVAGKKVFKTKIVMNNVHFLPGNKKPDAQNGQPAQQQTVYPQQPVQQTVYPQQPVQQTVYPQQPVQQTAYPQQPVQQTVYPQQPVQQTAYPQQPVQQPVQQPIQQPVQQSYRQQQPVQQAQQQVNAYVTDEQFISGMGSPDDLPF